jgi:hypothetical protein
MINNSSRVWHTGTELQDIYLQGKDVEATKEKGKRRKKSQRPKPKEQEGMPQHQIIALLVPSYKASRR